MLRTFLAGAVAAFVGTRLIRMNEEGKLDPLKNRIKDRASNLRAQLAEKQDALITPAKPVPAPAASRKARKSADPKSVSQPIAPVQPWPDDPKAMPEG